MKVVIPLSSKDVHLLPSFLEVQERLQALANYPVVLAPSGAVMFDAEGAADRLRLFCSSVTVMDVGYQEMGKWPQGPNSHWIRTVYALGAANNGDIWFWNELDCLPIVRDAYDVIKTAHGSGGKLFCGRIVDTPHRDGAGNIVKEKDDVMMMGCGVYPANIQMAPNFGPIAKGFIDGVNTEPFDKFIRWFASKHGMSHTDAIGDRWNTGNYRVENGALKCDALPTEFTARDHSKTDLKGAVVIHGCKDDSLAKLVLDGFFEKKDPLSFTEAPATFEVPPSAPEVSKEEFAALCNRVTALEQRVHKETTKPVEQEKFHVEQSKSQESKSEGMPSREQILALVTPKAKRLSQLMQELGIRIAHAQDFRKHLADNGFDVSEPLKWVKPAA